MSTTALTTAHLQTQAIRRPHPLLSVVTWELRRLRASRLVWVQALGFFALVLFVIWSSRAASQFTFRGSGGLPFNGFVAGTSAWGLVQNLPTGPLLLLGILLPFLNVDGVTRDLSRRTHELLMTTPLPNWAYIWGRYLTGLLLSIGLALLLLAAILGMGLLLHLTTPAYPLPPTGAVLFLWLGMVMTAAVLISSVSFALGTALPRQSTLVKLVLLLAWFVGAVILPGGNDQATPPTWYSAWDPTSAATGIGMLLHYRTDFDNLLHTATNTAQWQQTLVTIENTVPDISVWLAPHVIEALLSLVVVLAAAFTFQRFRTAFGA